MGTGHGRVRVRDRPVPVSARQEAGSTLHRTLHLTYLVGGQRWHGCRSPCHRAASSLIRILYNIYLIRFDCFLTPRESFPVYNNILLDRLEGGLCTHLRGIQDLFYITVYNHTRITCSDAVLARTRPVGLVLGQTCHTRTWPDMSYPYLARHVIPVPGQTCHTRTWPD